MLFLLVSLVPEAQARTVKLNSLFPPLPAQAAWLYYQRPVVLSGQRLSGKENYWKFTAQIRMFDEHNNSLGGCTGVLISPNAALTAAHCLDESETAVKKVKLVFYDHSTTPAKEIMRSTESFRIHPTYLPASGAEQDDYIDAQGKILFDYLNYSMSQNSYKIDFTKGYGVPVFPELHSQGTDLGVIYFTNEMPAHFEPVAFYEGQLTKDFKYGANLVGIGFGLNALNIKSLDNELRFTDLAILGVLPNASQFDLLTFATKSEGLIFGDSGGPTVLVKEGKSYLIGINSSSFLNGHATHSLPGQFSQWIADTVQELINENRNI